jgi:hypothetical protein
LAGQSSGQWLRQVFGLSGKFGQPPINLLGALPGTALRFQCFKRLSFPITAAGQFRIPSVREVTGFPFKLFPIYRLSRTPLAHTRYCG